MMNTKVSVTNESQITDNKHCPSVLFFSPFQSSREHGMKEKEKSWHSKVRSRGRAHFRQQRRRFPCSTIFD
jgi:hypothetical protein